MNKEYVKKSHSQFGEDLVLESLMFSDKIEEGFYVDIGSYDPVKYSNTFIYYKKGWSGINIDARPGSMKIFNRKRPRDINLEIGISSNTKTMDFYTFKDPAFNTFSKNIADKLLLSGVPFEKKITNKTTTLEKILDEHLPKNKVIDFMTIDVEGLDLEVLKSNNWEKYKPNYLLIEMHDIKFEKIKDSDIYRFLKQKGYELMSIAFITLIFKNKK